MPEKKRHEQEMVESYPWLSVEGAIERFLRLFTVLPAEEIDISDGLDRVLARDIVAINDIPPLANSAMDGYAVCMADISAATAERPVRLRIAGNLAAGYVRTQPVAPGTAVRIMTGAPVPPGTEAVVPFEQTERDGDWVTIFKAVKPGRNVRAAGEDVQRGEVILPAGTTLRPQEIGMLAALGYRRTAVVGRPRVAILATGDELVDVEETPGPGQIRNANSYANAAQVLRMGGLPISLGIAKDNIVALTEKLHQAVDAKADLILTSGGVSLGDFDVVKDVLAAEGEIHFWRVQMKPGKPAAMGQISGIPLLGLPGNPVSAMITFELFARPAMAKMQNRHDWRRQVIDAHFMNRIKRKDHRRHYLRVRLQRDNGAWQAFLTGDQGSGILRSMVLADGLAVIPESWDKVEPGAIVQVMLLGRQFPCDPAID